MQTQGKDNWRLDIPQVIELVGRKPHDVQVHNKHVVCYFEGIPAVIGEEGKVSLGGNIQVRFMKW